MRVGICLGLGLWFFGFVVGFLVLFGLVFDVFWGYVFFLFVGFWLFRVFLCFFREC